MRYQRGIYLQTINMEEEKMEIMNILENNSYKNLEKINRNLNEKNPDQVLKEILNYFPPDRITMGTGFGAPGVALIDILLKVSRDISIFYLDTELLFPETYDVRDRIESKYNIRLKKITPDISLKKQDELLGEKLWERNPDQCCSIRKVTPLIGVLEKYDVWITGIRRSQTKYRDNAKLIEFDPRYNVIKVNPILNWTHNQVWFYIITHNLPYNKLHEKGYISLGCTHCTTPVLNGEDDRAGRWRGFKKTECGLHVPQEQKNGFNKKINVNIQSKLDQK